MLSIIVPILMGNSFADVAKSTSFLANLHMLSMTTLFKYLTWRLHQLKNP